MGVFNLCGRWYRDLAKRGEGGGFGMEAEGKLTECPLALCVCGGWSIQTCLLLAFDMVTDSSVHKESVKTKKDYVSICYLQKEKQNFNYFYPYQIL